MRHLLLSVGLLTASAALAHADVWTTTEPDGSQARTTVRRPNEPARDYSRGDSTFYPSQTTTIVRGARVPDNVNQLAPRQSQVLSSQLSVGTWVPSYPQYYSYPSNYCPPTYPAYPAPVYSYPPTYTPLTPHAGIVTSGGVTTGYPVAGYPYGYPAYGYAQPITGYYSYPQVPTWNYYGYNGPGLGGISGSYSRSTNSTYGGVSVGGRGGPRVSVGGNRTTTSGSYSTFP